MHSPRYKTKETALSGIKQYLHDRKLWKIHGTQFYDPDRELNRILLGYFKFYNIDTTGIMRSKKMIAVNPAARIIQKNFTRFVEYLKTLK
jgi:hypothetical protein